MSDGMDCTCAAYSESECCCGADWTPQEVIDLRRKLAESQAREAQLRDKLRQIADLRNLGKIDPEVIAFQALAATQDLSGLVLCEAEPVAWMQDNGCYFSVAEDEFHEIPLYKARKP